MITETLYTRHIAGPMAGIPSRAITVTNMPYSLLAPGHGCREEWFGIKIAPGVGKFHYQVEGDPEKRIAILMRLSDGPNGEGQEIFCWVRII